MSRAWAGSATDSTAKAMTISNGMGLSLIRRAGINNKISAR